MLRKHWYGAVYEVDGCGALLSLLVYYRPLKHIMANISYVNANLPYSVFDLLYGYGIVKVFSIAWVDSDGEGIAKVFSLDRKSVV